MSDMSRFSNTVLQQTLRGLLRPPPAALAMLGVPGLALAGPIGEDVIRGSANVVRPDANNTVINQFTDRAVINWQSFNVDADEYVLFNQPGASSIVLNRVLGGDTSYILGHIEANGQVFLLNPNGVFFTYGATLDVQGFLASTLDMDPDAFMAGDFSLARNASSPATASVVNDGQITAGPGGYVVLAGDFIENTGIITANAGTVALVSGNALTLDIEGDGLVSFTVDEATLSEAAGVRNAGSLIADGGRVIMTAKVANDLVATAVNNEGLVRAHAVEQRNGEIFLVGHGGDVVNSGTLDADGENANGGGIGIYSDRDVVLADGGVQTAAGDANHSGGMIRAVAEGHLDYRKDNLVRVTGGASGGFVEVSGHGGISLLGIPDIGNGGELLVDPQWMAIRNTGSALPSYHSNASTYQPQNFLGALPSYVGASDSLTGIATGWISGQLQAGVDVTLVAEQGIFTDTSVTPIAIGDTSGGGNLAIGIGYANWNSTMTAVEGGGNDPTQFFGGVFSGTAPTITWLPNGRIDLGALDIRILGNLDVRADSGQVALGELSANNIVVDTGGTGVGQVSISGNPGTAINATGNITITAGSITTGYIETADAVTLNGNVAGTNLFAGSSSGTAANNVGSFRVNGDINVTGGIWINVANGGNITVTGNAAAGSGVTFSAQSNGSLEFGGRILTQQGVTLTGNVVGTGLLVGSSAQQASNLDIDGAVNVLGDVEAWVRSISPGAGINANGNITAGGGVFLHATGSSGAAPFVTVAGDINANGSVDIRASGSAGGGNIDAGNIAGDTIRINAIGTSFSGGGISVGALDANGSINVSANGGDASITVNGSVRANDHVLFDANGFSYGGNIDINGDVVSGARIELVASGFGTSAARIETGGLKVINESTGAVIHVRSNGGGDINIAGDILASGQGGNSEGGRAPAANVDLWTSGSGSINVTGAVTLTGNPGSFDSGSGSGTSGAAVFYAEASGSGDLAIDGPIKVSGAGHAEAYLYGRNVTAGNITVAASPVSFADSRNDLSSGSNIVAAARGLAEIIIATGVVNGIGTIDIGNLSATGPDAMVRLVDATAITTGAIAVRATGNDIETSFTSNYGGTVLGHETVDGGFAALFVGQQDGFASSLAIDINGAIDVAARGQAMVDLQGTTVETRGIAVTATAGNFSRSGDVPSSGSGSALCDGICSGSGGSDPWPYDGDFGGPKIDEGTVTAGAATIRISGMPGGFSGTGSSGTGSGSGGAAQNVLVDGSLAVSAPGTARIEIYGDDIAVSGNIDATATRAEIIGSYTDSGSTASGALTAIAGTVDSSIGVAAVEIKGLFQSGHDVAIGGAVTVSGPRTNFNATGGAVTMNDLSVTATGLDMDVTETETVVGGTATNTLDFHGTHLVAGNGIEAIGAINAGDVRIEGPGAAGIIFRGDTITTGSIKVRATAAEFAATIPSYNGGAATTEQTGAAVLGFESANAATVNGSIIVEGALTAHVGGRVNASGDFTVSGGKGVFTAVPGYVDFLDHIDDGDVGEDPLVLPAAAIRAANISASVTNGNLLLGSTQFTTTGALVLNAGGNVDFANRTQSAGSFAITGGNGVNISGSTLNATGATSVTAGNTLDASGTQLRAASLALEGAAVTLQGAIAETSGATSVIATTGALDLDNAAIEAGTTLRLEAGTDMHVSNVSLTAPAIAMIAGDDITNSSPPGTITAGTLAITAGGDVDLGNTTLVIGSGAIASVPGDTFFLDLLALENLPTPLAGPNLAISAQSIVLNGGSLAGDYVYLQTNRLAVNGTFNSSNPNLLLQVAPLGAGAMFSLQDGTAGGGDAAYTYNGALDAFGAGTIALGSTNHTGGVRIGADGTPIDIGDTNLFVLTGGPVEGLELVLSTGVVKDLATLIGGGFDVPQTDEIDTGQDLVQSLNDQYKLDDGDDGEEGDEEGEDTDTDTGAEDDDDDLIRRDTVDEEMMCE